MADQNEKLRANLGAAYQNIEIHIEKNRERKAQIASLITEIEQDKHSVIELKKKLEELFKELNNEEISQH